MTCSVDAGLQGQGPDAIAMRLRRNFRHIQWKDLYTSIPGQGWSLIKPLRKVHGPDAAAIDEREESPLKKE